MINYKTIFNFASFAEFMGQWNLLNDEYQPLFKEYMSAKEVDEKLKTIVGTLYNKIRTLNKHGLVIYPNQMEQLKKSKKIMV